MTKILINDGIDPAGKRKLEDAGIIVDTTNIPQELLAEKLNDYDGICVRSATKVRKDLIDASPNIKLIGRGGVGMDNIDVEYAKSKGIEVINTPASSSRSVAELVFAHMLTASRFVHQANRQMPVEGNTSFNALKKSYANGVELGGKTLGVIGFGRIGQEVAKIGLGMGMKIAAMDVFPDPVDLECSFGGHDIIVHIEKEPLETLLAKADYLSIHTPFTGTPIIGKREFDIMKEGVILVNASRGGTLDEDALIDALDSGKVAHAALDVFENEPTPDQAILNHKKISLSPHIGASTLEAQERIGLELADQIIRYFKHG
jgi:D-3-phosphoglycerate dehydrogenase